MFEWIKRAVSKLTFSLIVLPNVLEYCFKSLSRIIYGHEVELLLAMAGIYAINFFLASYFIYKWFVKGQGTVKVKTRQKIKQILRVFDQIKSYFTPGNQHNLVKLYFMIVSGKLIYQILPGIICTFLLGLLIDFYGELKIYFERQQGQLLQSLKRWSIVKFHQLLQSIPRHITTE